MNLVRFAGHDPHENLKNTHRPKAIQAYELWSIGWDTLRIAARLKISEAAAHKLVTQERSRLIGRSDPYGVSNAC